MTPAERRNGVLFLCSQLGVGGAERLWANLIPELQARGVPVELIAVNRRGETFEALTSRGIATGFLDAGDGAAALRTLPGLVTRIRRTRPQAIVAFGASSFALAAIAGRITGTPAVANWHQQVGRKWQGSSASACRIAARFGAGVICVSDDNVADITRYGFPADRIRVVRNGVPSPGDAPRQAANAAADALTACLAARLAPEKRIDRFIEAVAIASREVPGIKGVVAGAGPLQGELVELRDRLASPVELIGLHPEPTELMLESDVVCLTSDFEAAPVTLMEAAACGRPTIATDSGEIGQMIDDGITGFIAAEPTAEAVAGLLVTLARDPDRRAAMGLAARQRWEASFSLDRMVDGYLELLGGVTGPPLRWPDPGVA